VTTKTRNRQVRNRYPPPEDSSPHSSSCDKLHHPSTYYKKKFGALQNIELKNVLRFSVLWCDHYPVSENLLPNFSVLPTTWPPAFFVFLFQNQIVTFLAPLPKIFIMLLKGILRQFHLEKICIHSATTLKLLTQN